MFVTRTLTMGMIALLSTVPAAHGALATGSGGSAYYPEGESQTEPSPAEGTSPQDEASPAPGAQTGSGGASYGRGLERAGPDHERPVLSLVKVTRGPVLASGRALRVTYRIADRSRRVKVTLAFVRPDGAVAFRARLGWKRTGRNHTFSWSSAQESRLMPAGPYHMRVSARDPDGNRAVRRVRVRRSRTEPAPPPALSGRHFFPVRGAYSLGGADARFGAPRRGHTHRGQDISADLGTPVVAPTAGTISWRAYQESGAGYYLVLDAAGEDYDFVFMHLQRGSLLVRQGDRVSAGQQLAGVGNTGYSFGPHLHFEVWRGTWYGGGTPIDPLPLLRTWAAG